jgi:hypothetical protein
MLQQMAKGGGAGGMGGMGGMGGVGGMEALMGGGAGLGMPAIPGMAASLFRRAQSQATSRVVAKSKLLRRRPRERPTTSSSTSSSSDDGDGDPFTAVTTLDLLHVVWGFIAIVSNVIEAPSKAYIGLFVTLIARFDTQLFHNIKCEPTVVDSFVFVG